MKICPQCTTGFHDSVTTCPTHGGLLSEIRDLKPGMMIRETYLIQKKLGKGGMGSVYLATHTLLDEPRALKFLSQDLSEDEAFTGRFLREVRTLRSLRNRNVVDCGDPERAEDGSLFFSMEFVDGPTLRDFMKTAPKPFDVRLALEIMRGIAEGLGAAHSKGVVHRDIKPENILMGRDGAAWVPKIVDFGIVATKEVSNQTRTGSMLLTMAYAAPEQWRGTRAAELDGRTDLYALGGVLFEMLTGRTAFDAENYHEWAQKHMNANPPPPSSVRPDLARWKGLDALVLRLLAKDVNERPRDVAELLALLGRITYDPTVALPPTRPDAATVFYEPPKTPTQRPVTGQTTSQSFATPPAGQNISAPPQTSVPPPARPAATYASPSAPPRPQTTGGSDTPTVKVNSARIPSDASSSDARTSGPQATANSERTTTSASQTSGQYRTMSRTMRTTTGRTTTGRTGQARTTGSGAAVAEKEAKGSKLWIWIVVLLLLGGGAYAGLRFYQPKEKVVTLKSQSDAILSIAFSSDGQTLATASHDNTIQLWKTSTDMALNTIRDHVTAIAFSSDGHTLAAADWDKNVQLWGAASGQILDTMDGHTAPVLAVAFSPDGHMVASGSADKTVRLWSVATGKSTNVLTGHSSDVRSVAFSPDGQMVASGSADDTINLWDAATGKLVRTLKGHARGVNAVCFSSDGHTLASASDDMSIILWDPSTGAVEHTLHGHTDAVRTVAFSPDGKTLASGSDDTTVRLWSVASGAALATLQGHGSAVNSVAFSPDGTTLASGSADTTIRLWDLTTVHY